MKSKTTALILSIFLGALGVDRFYLGYIGMGILKLFTGGCFGILTIIDIIMIATGKLVPADGTLYEEDSSRKTHIDTRSPNEKMKEISSLYEEGLITSEEFERLKASCLDELA